MLTELLGGGQHVVLTLFLWRVSVCAGAGPRRLVSTSTHLQVS